MLTEGTASKPAALVSRRSLQAGGWPCLTRCPEAVADTAAPCWALLFLCCQAFVAHNTISPNKTSPVIMPSRVCQNFLCISKGGSGSSLCATEKTLSRAAQKRLEACSHHLPSLGSCSSTRCLGSGHDPPRLPCLPWPRMQVCSSKGRKGPDMGGGFTQPGALMGSVSGWRPRPERSQDCHQWDQMQVS